MPGTRALFEYYTRILFFTAYYAVDDTLKYFCLIALFIQSQNLGNVEKIMGKFCSCGEVIVPVQS